MSVEQHNTIAVLGGLGFIGTHLCCRLLEIGYHVRVLDKAVGVQAGNRPLIGRIEIVEADVSNPEQVLRAIGDSQVVINLIHSTVPSSSMEDPRYDVVSNIAGTVGWLELLKQTNVSRILYVSSGGTVYGLPETIPITEAHPTNPICSYGITKLAIEKYVLLFAKEFGIKPLILRPSNVYGPGQRLHLGQGVIGILGSRALYGKPLEIWGSGNDLRDYLFIDDFVSAVISLISYDGPHYLFNVSSGKGHSVLEIVSILQKHVGRLSAVVHNPARGFDAPVNVLDSSRIHAEIEWRPAVDVETGIYKTVQWLKESRYS